MGLLASRQRMGLAAVILAASAFLSRLMGLIRDKIISWQFGAGSEADLYFAAFVVPDIINYLLAGAFISITIMPVLARGFEENPDSTWRFFSCVTLWMTLLSLALTLGGELSAEKLARLVAPGFNPDQLERLAFFTRIILPAQIFFLCGSCFTALLLLRRQFVVPSLSPLIYNSFIILCGLSLPTLPFLQDDTTFGMTGYCLGVTLGAFCGAFLLPLIVAIRGEIHFKPTLIHPWLGKFLKIALPLMLGQTVVMLDEQFLRIFGSMLGEGQISLLNYGRRIAQVPIALVGQAAAVASYPFLVQLIARNEKEKFEATLRKAMTTSCLLIIPCAMLMLACAEPILELIFQGGRFGSAETLACLPLTRLLLLPAPIWIIYMILVRAYYAFEDSLTPAITGTIITLFCIPAYFYLAVPLGAWAITAVSGLSLAAYLAWLCAIWTRRHGSAAFAGLLKNSFTAFIICLPGAGAAFYLCDYVLKNFAFLPIFLMALLRLALCGSVFLIISGLLLAFFQPGIFRQAVNKIPIKLLKKRSDTQLS